MASIKNMSPYFRATASDLEKVRAQQGFWDRPYVQTVCRDAARVANAGGVNYLIALDCFIATIGLEIGLPTLVGGALAGFFGVLKTIQYEGNEDPSILDKKTLLGKMGEALLPK